MTVSKKPKPYKFSSDLRYGEDDIIPYEEQLDMLLSKGFALWDLIGSCERKGSLDADIKSEVPNNIKKFCDENPSVKRIVFSNGKMQSDMFKKHFKEWWETGQLVPAVDSQSQAIFGKVYEKSRLKGNSRKTSCDRTIECVCALAVSPAAASISYIQKREFWEANCYIPGLLDFEKWKKSLREHVEFHETFFSKAC